MAVVQVPFLVAVLLLVSPGLHCSSPPPACPESCTCQRASLLNCSSSGLSSLPQHIQDSVTGLDLSQNRLDTVTLHRPYRNLRNVWLENNTITRLSLCIDTNLGTQSVRGRHSGRLGLSSRRRCVSWAPALQLLSVERNQLIQLPEGLERSASLWVLQLSFNRISTLRPGELRHLRQLKELHLKHNLITSLHPQMFQDLAQLRVLDLSFNMLTNLHPSMYLSLRNIGSDVRLDGNRWLCDCSMRSLRRCMAYDSNRGLQTWGVVCAFPSVLSGKDLLQLEEDDLNCIGTENSPELHRDVTVYSGSEILLSCSKQDSLWLTPSGQESVSGPQASLLIGDATDKDTGLYVCMTEDHEVVSVFNLQISRVEHASRKTRSLPRNTRQVIPQITTNRIGQERNQGATQSDLALAVCLSVFITFLIAFILGVLARPFIEVLCTKITNKRNPTGTNSVSSSEQRQYENEAYSEGEEPEEIVTHRERRVTFRTVNTGEDINVEYYDTVASGNQQSVEATNTEEDEHTAGDSGSENGSRQINPGNNQRDARDISGTTNTRRKHRVQFDNIPDSEKLEERSLSSCSDSSLSDREFKKDRMNKRAHTSPKSLQRAEDSVQQGADSSTSEIVEAEELSIERTREMSELSSEPFTDWSPHADDTRHTDSGLWQENEEQFEFSDSVGSNSARSSSLFGSFNYSKHKVLPTSDIQSRDDVSSCSSSLSADEPTRYTVNPDQEEEDTENNHNKSELTNTCPKQDASFQQQISGVDTSRPPVGFNQGIYPHDTLRSAERPEQTSSSQSSDSEQMQNMVNEKVNKEEVREYYKPSSGIVAGERDTREKIKPMPRSRRRGDSLGVGEMHKTSVQFQESHTASRDSDAHWPALDLDNKIRIKRRLDIKAPSPSPDSSSGKIQQNQDVGWPALDLENIPTIKRRLDVKSPSPFPYSSSSSESDDKTTGHTEKTIPQKVHNSGLLLKKSQTANHGPDARWPALDLENIPTIKRRLDVTAPSPPPDSSSSSESDDETTHAAERPGKVDHSGLLLKESQTANLDPDAKWPALDLENIPTINRRLDVKAPSPSPDSSSSSDSEDETTGHTEKTIPQKVDHSGLLLKESQTANPYLDARWPALDLENIPTIKRRLDIKAPSPPPDSSSSSDSDDKTKYHTVSPGTVDIVNLPLIKSQTLGHNIHTGWPALDLENIPTIKRRLDIKAPSPPPDSSSSSDSEDETTHATERPGKVGNATLPLQKIPTATHDPDARWPALDLEHIPTIERRLDVKAPSPSPDSSSSSDSEDETTGHTEKTIPQKVHHSGLLLKTPPTANLDPDAKWPAVDLENIPTIKRRLDVKAPSPPPDSASSSDRDDEATHATERPGKVGNAALPLLKISTATHDPDAKWPALDLEHIPTIKRRLDIKAPSPPPDSSSSSESDDETTGHTEKTIPQKVDHSGLLLKTSPSANLDPDAKWPAVDLENIPTIKRRLDIKAPSPPPDSSSSSDSDDETTGHTEKTIPQKVHHSGLLLKESQTANLDPDAKWPALDLENIPTIKRRLDIKAPSPPPDSSSSSDSDDKTKYHTESPGKVDIVNLPLIKSQTLGHNIYTGWPALDLENIPTIKRRLDIKAPSPPPDSSSSSDSEDETTHATERPGKVGNATLPLQKIPTATHDPDARWPALDLEHIPTIERRLDVKAPSPSPDSSFSSDSEDETTGHTEKTIPQKVHHSGLLLKTPPTANLDPDAKWPALDLENIPTIKRRLDVKAPSPPPDSSSSSDSDDETTGHTEKTIPQKVHHSGLLLKTPPTANLDPDAKWPALDLENIPTIKRRLDVKAPSPPPDSASSSDRDDEATHATERPGKVGNAALPLLKIPTATHDPDAKWPAVDLENIPTIKRRLDIKAPSPPPDSSSSSESEDETTGHTEKTIPQKVDHSGLLLKTSPSENLDPDAKWPAVDLENIPTIKRRLDVKAPSPPPDSASSSDRDDEATHATERPGKVGNAALSLHKFPTATHDPDARWPALDLEHIPTIKRRLDVKAPSPPPDSASSSDSDDETPGHTENTIPQKVDHSGLLLKTPPTANLDPDAKWPAVDLENIPTIKRRLDVKAPSPPPDSSSSSDSDDETTGHTEKTIPQKVHHSGLLLKESQTANLDPDAKWPALDLENIPTIKRRLDIKAPSPPPDSSSSSDSEDETTGHTEKTIPQKVDHSGLLLKTSPSANLDPDAKWPAVDLENIPTIKRRLDVKAPSPPPDSASSSDSDDETPGHTEKTIPQKFHHSGLLLKTSASANLDPDAKWPAIDLENIPTIKRRLDVKAPSPSPDSSSSSDSEDETKGHTEKTIPQKVHHSGLLLKESQTATHDPDARWPALDLLNIPTIKRRLDIKAPSPPPDSSSSSKRDDETTRHTEKTIPQKVDHSGLLLKTSPSANLDPDAKWPAVDLENIPTIKRRLDVKAPSPPPDSASSSDSDDETTHAAERPGKVGNAALPLQAFPTATHDPDARWPALDLENIPTIKRRLDVKAPSPPPDSASSSESDDETTGHTEKTIPQKVDHSGLLLKTSPTANLDPDARWPALDLLNIPTIKRHLDVKAPSPSPDSSSSSDSEDKTTGHTEKKTSMKFHHSGLLLKESQKANRDLDARWPALNLENIPTIKRRLDIKAPSPDSNSSSSSDNEEDITHHKARPAKVDTVPIKKHEQGKVNLSTFPLHKSETVSYDPLGSAVNLNHITRIKRRLDIKARSSPPKSLSDESTVQGKIKEANKMGPHYSSSSSVEQDEYTEDISNPSMTIKPHPDPRWPELGLSSAPRIKRYLDIKTHSPSTESSSSSHKSDSESTNLPVKVERDRTVVGITNYYPVTKFSDMKKSFSPINRPLNIRGPPQPADSSFSSSANGTLSSHTEKHEMDKDGVRITTQEQQKVMHNINLGIPKMRRRLDIKAPSPQPDLVLDSTSADVRQPESNSSTSESEDENRGNKVKWSPKSQLINISPKPKTDHTIKLEKYTVITDDLRDKPTNDNISPTPEINPELQSRWNNMNLGVSRFRKRLDITSQKNVPPNLPTTPLPDSPSSYTGESGTGNKTSRTRLKKNLEKLTEEKSNPDTPLTGFGTPRVGSYLDTTVIEKAPGTSPLHQQSDSVSSSESEGTSTEYADYTWRGRSQLSVVPDVAAPQNRTSLLVTHAADESRSGTQVERKAGVELKSQASEEGDGSASMWPNLSLTNIPKVKRALDIRAPLRRESFSCSNSEDEPDHTVPELKRGVPRINRRLNIKAPSPEPNTSSSSSSESDNEVTGYSAQQSVHSSNMSAMTDDDYSQIAYKRTIIKAPRQRNSFSSSGRSHTSDHSVAQAGLPHRVDDGSASLSQWGVSSIEEQSTLDVSPEIRWTGIGRNLPDFSSASRRLNLGVPPPERAPPAEPELTPPDSSDKIKRDRVKAYESLMDRFSYPTARGSVASSRSLDKFENTSRSKSEIFRALSEDRNEKKGLGALKAISSKRRQWDTEDKEKDAV